MSAPSFRTTHMHIYMYILIKELGRVFGVRYNFNCIMSHIRIPNAFVYLLTQIKLKFRIFGWITSLKNQL